MRDTRNRNSEILNMRKRGLSYGEIAHMFDISRDRVRQILKELDFEEKRKRRIQKILQHVRSSNNIEEEWPRELFRYEEFAGSSVNFLDCISKIQDIERERGLLTFRAKA